nr:MAG TPA: hypothetical protein [Caudoviricetes sp.]
MVCPLVTYKESRSFTRRKRCFLDHAAAIRISNNLFSHEINSAEP